MATFLETDVETALNILRQGGIILYPTDTIWGLGCDATNEEAVKKIFTIKKRADAKSMIILLADERSILQYVAAPDMAVFDFIEQQNKPTTIVFENAIGLPDNLVAADGSIGIRIAQDAFCKNIIKRLRKPLVSTSANISGNAAPKNFKAIDPTIKNAVDYIVQWRQDDETEAQPSQVVKWNNNGAPIILRS